MSEDIKNIYEAMLHVYNKLQKVINTGEIDSSFAQYSYASETDLLNAVRPLMVEAGIVTYCSGIDNIESTIYETTKTYKGENKVSSHSKLVAKYTFRFIHVYSETSIEICAVGEGVDSTDKDAYKAATGALKYVLRQSFLLITGDDPDKDASEPITRSSNSSSYSSKKTFKKKDDLPWLNKEDRKTGNQTEDWSAIKIMIQGDKTGKECWGYIYDNYKLSRPIKAEIEDMIGLKE